MMAVFCNLVSLSGTIMDHTTWSLETDLEEDIISLILWVGKIT